MYLIEEERGNVEVRAMLTRLLGLNVSMFTHLNSLSLTVSSKLVLYGVTMEAISFSKSKRAREEYQEKSE